MYFLAIRDNSDIKCPYFSQMDRIAGITTFYVLIFLWSFSDSLGFAGFLGVIPKSHELLGLLYLFFEDTNV